MLIFSALTLAPSSPCSVVIYRKGIEVQELSLLMLDINLAHKVPVLNKAFHTIGQMIKVFKLHQIRVTTTDISWLKDS